MDNKKFEKKMDFKAINILVDEIIDGKYNCENYELVENLLKLPRIQVRAKDDPKAVEEILWRIERDGITNCEPLLIFEKWGKRGVDVILDGSHTLAAVKKNKGYDMPTARISKERGNEFNKRELKLGGLKLNPIPKKYKKPSDYPDAVELVMDLIDVGHNSDSAIINDTLREGGFESQKLGAAKRAINREIKIRSITKPGYSWKDFAVHNQEEVDEKAKELSLDSNIQVIRMSSGNLKFETIINEGYDMAHYGTKRHIELVVVHPDRLAWKEWGKKIGKYKKRIKWSLNNITFDVTQMWPWEPDAV